MMCFGVSSLVLGNLATVFFAMGQNGWRWTYFGLGAAIFVSFLFGGMVLRKPREDEELPARVVKRHKSEDFEPVDFTTGEMLRRKAFIMFYMYNFLTAAIGSSVFSFAKDYALFAGATPVLATMLVGLASICNGVGRISCGIVYDTCGRRFTMLLVNLLGIVATVILLIGSLSQSIAMCIAGLCFAGVSYGSGSTISATFVGNFYGMKSYSMNLGIVTSALIPASVMATISSLMIAASGSYVSTFIMLFCCGAVAFVLNLAIKRP